MLFVIFNSFSWNESWAHIIYLVTAYLIDMAAHISFSEKKVDQIFCFDWEKISEKTSK